MRKPSKHGFVDATLTRAELEAPFRLGDGAAGVVERPARVYCEIRETRAGLMYRDRDPATGAVLDEGRLSEV